MLTSKGQMSRSQYTFTHIFKILSFNAIRQMTPLPLVLFEAGDVWTAAVYADVTENEPSVVKRLSVNLP